MRLIPASVSILLVLLSGGCKKTTLLDQDLSLGSFQKQTIHYKTMPGVAPNLLSLDLYSYADRSVLKPVVLYVHGGGWATGDKANKMANKVALFNSLKYLLISVNYRLSPSVLDLTNTTRVKYPDHSNDLADAIKWVVDSIGHYGGDATRIVLLGHSSGAQLVALMGTSQLFLPARHVALPVIKGIASIDTEGYDVPSQSSEPIYQNAFGTDPAVHLEASPLHQLSSAYRYPNFFIAKRGTPARLALADRFIGQLITTGVKVSQVTGSQYDHEGINEAIGDPGDMVITPALKAFLQTCFQ